MANVHVIIGADDYLVGETAKKTVGDGVGLETVDSRNATNAELQLADLREVDASFSTPPFLDPRKVTWWKNVHFLPHAGGKAVAADVKAALEKFAGKIAAAHLPDNQHLIISGPSLLKASVFAKKLAPVAEMVVFETGKPWQEAKNAAARVVDLAAGAGLAFGPGAAQKFVSVVGTDSRSLMSELGKMRDYLGRDAQTITCADVEAIASQGVGVEPVVWSVTDAVGRRDLAAALEAMRKFELQNGFDVFMSGVLEKFFRQMLDVAAGRTEGLAPFAVSKNRDFLRNWTTNELRIARWRFLTLREKVVWGTASGDTLVVTELVRVMRKGR